MTRRPKPVTAPRVMRWAQWYLERWSASEGRLRRRLWDKANKGLAEHGGDRDAVAGWIEDAVRRSRELGWVDDARYAADVAASLRRRGNSDRAIRSKLREKEVPPELIDEVLGAGSDLEAARTFARKRAIGPWRRAPVDPEGRRKELAKLGRAGFSFDIARQVVDEDGST